jgi:hypothetical protein
MKILFPTLLVSLLLLGAASFAQEQTPAVNHAGGRLYCFGGGLYAQNAFHYVQIYQS